jgi:hypothetical protein
MKPIAIVIVEWLTRPNNLRRHIQLNHQGEASPSMGGCSNVVVLLGFLGVYTLFLTSPQPLHLEFTCSFQL